MLNSETWGNLEQLLSKAGLYTQFLTEQLAEFDASMEGSLEQVSRRRERGPSEHLHPLPEFRACIRQLSRVKTGADWRQPCHIAQPALS